MNYVAESRISEALDIGPRAVRLKAIDGGWPVTRKRKQGGNELFYIRDLLPVDVQKSLVMREAATGNANIPTVVRDKPVPKKSNKIGLAKYNLVHAFRLAKEQAGWGQKGEAAKDFLLAYNAGVLLPQVFKIVGPIKERTLDALDKKLRDHKDDYHALCDARGGWKKHGTNKYKGRKLSNLEIETFLKCYLHGAGPTVTNAIRATRAALAKANHPISASDSTFQRWLKDYEKFNAGVICMAREGMKAYQDKYAPYISRDASLLQVGQCLVADGKTLNFFIRHPKTGNKCRMTLIVFFDWASRYPAGWQIMPTEDKYGILAAFRNAVLSLGKYPESVYLDNGKAFKSKLFTETNPDFSEMTGLYARVGTAVTFAKPYNGRAKVVERFFKTFQEQLEWIMPSYCGDSIQTKPPWMHRNEKFQKAWHEARTSGWVPTMQEAGMIIDRYFQWYSQQEHKDLECSPADLFLHGRGPGVEPHQLNYDFLLRKKVRPRRCRIVLWSIEYQGDCLSNLSRDINIWVAVDMSDLRKVYCYTKDGIFLGEVHPVQACHPLARLFGDAVAIDQVKSELKRQRRIIRNTKQHLTDLGVTPSAKDSLNILPFSPKQSKMPVIPGPENQSTAYAVEPAALPEKVSKHLEQVAEQAQLEMKDLPEIPKPKYWRNDLEHYEWAFRYIHEHGRTASKADKAFMKKFESLPEFANYRQRYEDLKLVFNLN